MRRFHSCIVMVFTGFSHSTWLVDRKRRRLAAASSRYLVQYLEAEGCIGKNRCFRISFTIRP